MGHASLERLGQQIEEVRKEVEIGATYSHYKTPEHKYSIEFIGVLENTEEICVGYRALYGERVLWVRTLSDFTKEVETPNGKALRFIKCSENF